MEDMTSAEMSGWMEYLRMDDEVQEIRIARAIALAFNAGKKPVPNGWVNDEDEEVIDTTTPEFREHFKGFTNTPVKPVQRGFAGNRTMGTEIRMG